MFPQNNTFMSPTSSIKNYVLISRNKKGAAQKNTKITRAVVIHKSTNTSAGCLVA